MILGHNWWAIGALFIILLRIYFLKEPQVLIVTLITCGFFYYWLDTFKQHNQDLQQQVQQQLDQSVEFDFTAWADELDVDGNILKTVATLPQTDTKILVNAVIGDKTTKEQLEQVTGRIVLNIRGNIKLIDEATNPGQFDSRKFYALQQINATLSKGQVKVVQKLGDTATLIGWVHKLHQKVIAYFETLPSNLRFYGETLILGYIRSDFYQENQGIRELGLLHLFSISGFQVVMFIKLLRWFFNQLRIPIEITAILTLLLLPLYFLFSGSIPSLIRAIIVGMVAQGLLIIKSRLTTLDSWSLSLLGGVVIEPGILEMLGGQLSYLLALALVFVRGLKFWQEIIMMNLIILPLLLATTYQTHLLAFLANFIFIPIFTHLMVPLTTIGVLIFPIFPVLSNGIDYIIAELSTLITWLSKLPGNIIFGHFNIGLALLATGMTFYLMQNFKSRRGWLILLSIYFVGFVGLKIPLHGSVAFVDIGQGDSIVIQMPYHREVTIIDTGGRLAMPLKQSWQRRQKQAKTNADMFLVPYLMYQGIANIKQIILTHADADHAGDVEILLKTFKVQHLYVGQEMEKMPKYQQLANKYHVDLVGVHAGQKLPGLPLEILWPIVSGQGKNEDSVVTRGSFGKLNFLFMGDLNRENELRLPTKAISATQVIKLGHHGSKTSSDERFLQAAKPEIAIISAGRNNRYHHPHQETLATLAANKISYFSTARDGMIKYEWSLFGGHWSKMKSE